jgi:hypothetical protein
MRWLQSAFRTFGGNGSTIHGIWSAFSLFLYIRSDTDPVYRSYSTVPLYGDQELPIGSVVSVGPKPIHVETLPDGGCTLYTAKKLPSNSRIQVTCANAASELILCNRENVVGSSTPSKSSMISLEPAPLTSLRVFLSRSNMVSPVPQKYTVNTLKSLYTTIKAQSQLAQLGSGRISSLIRLLGSLSLSHATEIEPSLNMGGKPDGSDWHFVLTVANDKQRLGKRLSNADRYWIMRAELAIAHTAVGGSQQEGEYIASFSFSTSQRNYTALFRARTQYLRIRRYTADPEIHIPFLQSMLTLHPQRIAEITHRLCDLLRWHDKCHPRLVAFLLEVSLNSGLPTKSKAQLLSTLWTRLAILNRVTLLNTAVRQSKEAESDLYSKPLLDIRDLGTILTSVIFQRPSISSQEAVHLWALNQALRTFAPQCPLEARWNHLVSLLSFNTRRNSTTLHSRLNSHMACNADWSAVFTLSTLGNAFEHAPSSLAVPTKSTHDIGDLVHELWQTWSVGSDQQQNSPLVTCVIVTSFIRLAGILSDACLKETCFQHSLSHDLWSTEHHDDNVARQVKYFVAEYVASSVRCGSKNWPAIFSGVSRLPSQWRSNIVTMSISRLTVQDAEVAHQLYAFCSLDKTIQLEGSLIFSLSLSLASQHLVRLAIPFLQDPRLSQNQIWELMHAVVCSLTEGRGQYLDSKLFSILCDTMERSYATSPPPLAYRSSVQFSILFISLSGYASKSFAIIRAIHNSSSSFLSPNFLWRILKRIVKQRHYRLATRLLSLVSGTYRSHAVKWCRYLTFSLARAGANRLARQLSAGPIANHIRRTRIESLVRAVDFRLKSPARPLALKVMPIVSKMPMDGHSIRCALQILLRARRFLAARRLFERARRELDTKVQTVLGNMILHATLVHPSRQNGRQVRKVFSTLNFLVEKQCFVPDRVTANIALKSILLWTRGVDAPKLRAIFDHMIRIGYPAGNRLHIEESPFRTSNTLPSYLAFPNLPPFLSFQKHVRPMYKMFITAFFLRGDRQAAKTVIGILKAEEITEEGRRRKRYMARLKGARKKLLQSTEDAGVSMHGGWGMGLRL